MISSIISVRSSSEIVPRKFHLCFLQKDLETEIEYLKKKLDEAGQEKQDLMKLLNQEQSIHLQTQRKLMPPQEEQKEKGKKWFEFWIR